MPQSSAAKSHNDEVFILTRIFNAPRERLWRAWSDCAELKKWWGPKGFSVTHCKLELKPGGMLHYAMRTPQGQEMWGKFVFREIVPAERLLFINSFSDPEGGITRHPFQENWPLQMLTTITFKDKSGKTELGLRWVPYEASDIERKTFAANHASMEAGWGGTFDQLDHYLTQS